VTALRGITWDHPRGYAPLAASLQPYARLRDVSVEWEKRSLKDFGDAPIDALAEEYDLLVIDHPHVGLAAEKRCLLPLDEWIPAQVMETLARQSAGPSHASYSYSEHQWALAVDAAMQTSVSRPDLLQSGLPATWMDVVALGEKLKSKGMSIAVPLCPTDAICCFLTLCASMGSPFGRGPRGVDPSIGASSLRLLRQFSSLSPVQCLAWNPIMLLEHMSVANDIAYCPLAFCYNCYSRERPGQHRLRFRDIPGGRGSILGGTGIAVSSRCAFPTEACGYAAWICGAESQRSFYFAAEGQPANVAVWDDPEANARTDDFFSGTRRSLEMAYVRPRHPGFVDFQKRAGELINGFLRGQDDEQSCLSAIQREYEKTR